jgi:hypothetical protein
VVTLWSWSEISGNEKMPHAETPRSEPEIIPPDRDPRDPRRERVFVDERGTERVYFATIGPLGAILVVLVTAILSAVLLALLLGALVIWLPLVILFAVAAIIVTVLRGDFWRPP